MSTAHELRELRQEVETLYMERDNNQDQEGFSGEQWLRYRRLVTRERALMEHLRM